MTATAPSASAPASPPGTQPGPHIAARSTAWADLVIRRATADDAAAITAVMGHPEVQPNLLQVPYVSELRVRQMLSDNEQPGRLDLVLVAQATGRDGRRQVLGNAGLHPVGTHVRRRHAMNLGLGVLPEAQGQGVGRALMQALLHYADHWGQVLRIELGVFCDNHRAIALYQSLGFAIEGRQRGYALRDGRYDDVFSMARLHPRPPAWPPSEQTA